MHLFLPPIPHLNMSSSFRILVFVWVRFTSMMINIENISKSFKHKFLCLCLVIKHLAPSSGGSVYLWKWKNVFKLWPHNIMNSHIIKLCNCFYFCTYLLFCVTLCRWRRSGINFVEKLQKPLQRFRAAKTHKHSSVLWNLRLHLLNFCVNCIKETVCSSYKNHNPISHFKR